MIELHGYVDQFISTDRSGRVRWLLEELGVPAPAPRPRADNPRFESGAICAYLAEKFSDRRALAPLDGSPARQEYLQWMYFVAATLDPKFNEWAGLEWADIRPADADRRAASIQSELSAMARVLDAALEDREYLVGGEFSAADVMAALVCSWLFAEAGVDAKAFPRLEAYVARLRQRPAAIRSGVFDWH